ncbi:hypothetical protein H0B56_18580 [Haloechinothrix sp. YIM 98757]|uniref:Diacylglycerol kinase catalytic domain-containing protein n=1 Tax=Haloechinothrix aidingensis TaxID=2752311 RepID=A0A838AEH9_9PSEU|nr:hypothetical protein [Haloechinothrix aidingensis]
MRGAVIACGRRIPPLPGVTDDHVAHVGHRPGKDEIDPVLARAAELTGDPAGAASGADVVVAGTDGDLAAVVLRLLRTDRLATLSVGYVPVERESAVAAVWRLPTDPARAFDVATRAEIDRVPLIRDDAGGVLVGSGVLTKVRGVGYCDDTTALRGPARRIHAEPDNTGGPGLVLHVIGGLLGRRRKTFTGRAFQLGCDPTVPVVDGVAHPREVTRLSWYRHTEDLRLARGVVG